MDINRKSPEKYTVHKNGEHSFSLARILKDYNSDTAALEDLTKLAVGEITEKDLSGNTAVSDIEAGKLQNRINVLETAFECIRGRLIQAMGDSDRLEHTVKETIEHINTLVE
jgi:hypothetical protein